MSDDEKRGTDDLGTDATTQDTIGTNPDDRTESTMDTPGTDEPDRTTGPQEQGWTGAATTPPTTSTWPVTPPAPPAERGVRVGTVVWGLVLAAIGMGLIATVAGVEFDVELAVIALVAAAGVALLVGSLVKGRRTRT